MTKTKKGIIGITVALSMILSHALAASAYYGIPDYQWTDTPELFGEGITFVSNEDNPLEGFVSRAPYVSGVFFKTDMENVTAEMLGLPEDTKIERPGSYDFYNMKNSYIYGDESYYMIPYGLDDEIINTLVSNDEVDAVVTETCNWFSAAGTLAICIVSEQASELTPDDFDGMMVEKVVHMADNEFMPSPNICYVHLSAEAFENGIDYNVLYDYILNDMDIEYTKIDCEAYEIDSEGLYLIIEIAPHKYAYTLHKGDMTAAEDANGDYSITLDDAVTVLQSYASNAVASEPVYNESHDANGDGTVDLDDAVQILTRYANDAVGL